MSSSPSLGRLDDELAELNIRIDSNYPDDVVRGFGLETNQGMDFDQDYGGGVDPSDYAAIMEHVQEE